MTHSLLLYDASKRLTLRLILLLGLRVLEARSVASFYIASKNEPASSSVSAAGWLQPSTNSAAPVIVYTLKLSSCYAVGANLGLAAINHLLLFCFSLKTPRNDAMSS